MKALIAKAVGVFLVMALCFYLGHSRMETKATKEALTATIKHQEQLEKLREESQGELNAISEQWQAHLKESKGKAQRTIADLRSTGVRLRVELADAKVCSVTGDCGPEPNGKAELHPRASEFLVRQSQRADAQVEALQEVIKELQGGAK